MVYRHKEHKEEVAAENLCRLSGCFFFNLERMKVVPCNSVPESVALKVNEVETGGPIQSNPIPPFLFHFPPFSSYLKFSPLISSLLFIFGLSACLYSSMNKVKETTTKPDKIRSTSALFDSEDRSFSFSL